MLMLAAWRPAAAITLRFESVRDNTLYEDATGNTSNGAGQYFFAGTNQVSAIRRGVVALDLAQSLPQGTVVDSVVVILHMSRTVSGFHQVGLHRLLEDWGEGTSDAALEEGGGTQATSGDATWLHRFFSTPRWTNAGGDFEAAPSAVVGIGTTGFYSWSGAALRADVQQWVDDPSKNFGWLLHGDESTVATAKRFDTHENPEGSFRPQLWVIIDPATAVGDVAALAQRLLAARPSPFTGVTNISYELFRPGGMSLRVHDVRGRLVRTLVAARATAGRHAVLWDGLDEAGRELAAGSYFLVLEGGGERRSERLVLIR